ncbi:golgin subfamily A member 6-like protein 22 [Bombus pyrosoma]|uniref:golgin subfamily A member 6-like protein 22 n=1 Tax=Bombus pyrosoma TaxID=396416 RepID=UPI001CB8C299|nr:golgin subfamily A member 6-like protein 22 [Bombus pyrosoma]
MAKFRKGKYSREELMEEKKAFKLWWKERKERHEEEEMEKIRKIRTEQESQCLPQEDKASPGAQESGDKEDFKNTLDKYSLTEKETPTREKGMEIMTEKMGKMERRFEAMLKEIKGTFEKQVEEMKREMKEERERRKRERAREKEEWEREKKKLLGRIRRIEEEQDSAESEERRRNIVIKGVDWNKGSYKETVKEFIREKMRIGTEVERTYMIRVGNKNNNSGNDEIDGGKNKDNEGEKQTGKGGIHRRRSDKKRKGGTATHKKGSQRQISKNKKVWEYLKTFDVIGLTETWIEEDNRKKLKYRLPKEFDWKCRAAMKAETGMQDKRGPRERKKQAIKKQDNKHGRKNPAKVPGRERLDDNQ